jgi:hypothetical protein
MEKVNHKAINLAAARLRKMTLAVEAAAEIAPCDYCGKALRTGEGLSCHPGTDCVAVYCLDHYSKFSQTVKCAGCSNDEAIANVRWIAGRYECWTCVQHFSR